jgi:hypothetical protein
LEQTSGEGIWQVLVKAKVPVGNDREFICTQSHKDKLMTLVFLQVQRILVNLEELTKGKATRWIYTYLKIIE